MVLNNKYFIISIFLVSFNFTSFAFTDQCQGTTPQGNRCVRIIDTGVIYCWEHIEKYQKENSNFNPLKIPNKALNKEKRYDKIINEINSLKNDMDDSKSIIFTGITVQVLAYLLLPNVTEIPNDRNSDASSIRSMLFVCMILGSVMELVGAYDYFEASSSIAHLESKKYDMMEDE